MGGVVSNTGTWMQRVAQDWLVLQLHAGTRDAPHGARHHDRPAVPADPAALAVRRPGRRPHRQAAAAPADPGLDGAVRRSPWPSWRSPGSPSPGWSSSPRSARHRRRLRRPGPPVVRQRDGGQDDLTNAVSLNSATFNLARVVGPALSGALIAALGSGVEATGWVIAAQRGQLPRRDRRAAADAPLGAHAGRARATHQGDDPRRRPLRPRPAGPEDGAGRRLLRRHLRHELPDDLGPDGHAGLRQGRERVRPARHHAGPRLAHRRAAGCPAHEPAATAAGHHRRTRVRHGRGRPRA